MRVKIAIVASVVALAGMGSCIDPYPYDFEEKSNRLVVEGFITTLPGPHLIKLTTTRNIYNKGNEYKLFVENAVVSVDDGQGMRFRFREITPGHYYSDSTFAAELGKKYKLRIEAKGKIYESTEEEVFPTAEMHDVQANYAEKEIVSSSGFIRKQGGFNIRARINDNVQVRNQYLMRVSYTYIIYTAPPGCCSVCWISERLPGFEVFKDQWINGQQNAEVFLGFIPVMAKHFASKVYVEAEQYSLSPPAYYFWRSLYDVRERQGGLFDPAPAALPGNIFNVSDKDELVIGYFHASDVSKKGAFIYREQIPGQIYPPLYKTDCRQFANSTTVPPSFW